MKVRDLPIEKITIGLKLRSMMNPQRVGSVIREENVRGISYFWVKWDDDSEARSGFFSNNCDCEVIL